MDVQESGDESYMVKMRIGGNPGLVHLHVRDSAGEKGGSRLQSDRLDMMLEAGPPSSLMFDAPTVGLNCGTHSTLRELRVNATDEYGNKTTASFEVTLLSPFKISTNLFSCRSMPIPFPFNDRVDGRISVGNHKTIYLC